MPQCRYCTTVRIETGVVHKDGPHHDTVFNYGRTDVAPQLPALAASASLGCGLCGLLRECLQEVIPGWAAKWNIDLLLTYDICIERFSFSTENNFLRNRQEVKPDAICRIMFYVVPSVLPLKTMTLPFDITADQGKSPSSSMAPVHSG